MFGIALHEHDPAFARLCLHDTMTQEGFTPIDPSHSRYFKLELPRGVHGEYI
jgi:hypothetical protein